MAEVASAFVSLVPSARGFGSKLGGAISGDVKSAGKKSGISFGKVFAGAAAIGLGAKAFSFLGDSLGEATEAAVVGSRTENVIKKMGDAANISADQVGKLAGAISAKTGIDDEAIQSGQNLLLTFENIKNEAGKGNDIFNQTSALMVDLSAAMGTDAKGSAVQLGKALNDPVKGITALSRVGVSFTEKQKETIAALVETGDQMGAQKVILGELKKQFGGAAEAMATPADRARVAFGNLKEMIGTKLLPVTNGVLDFFVENLPGAIDTAVGVFATVRDAVTKFYNKASKNETVIAAFETITDVAKSLKDGLGDAVDNAKKIGTALGNIDLTKLDAGDLGKKLGDALSTALDSLVSLAGTAAKSLGKMFAKVDWVGIGIAIGKYVPALLVGLAAGILAFDLGSLLSGLADNWGTILIGVITLAFAPAKLIGPLTKILTKIPFVGKFIAAAVVWISQVGTKLTKFGKDLWSTFTKAFLGGRAIPGAGLVAKVMASIKGIPGRVRDFMTTLGVRLGVWALDAMAFMGKGFGKAIPAILRFIASIPGKILSAIGSLAKLLFPKGSEAIAGLANGLRSKISVAIDFVKGIPGRILSVFSGAATLLYNAGSQLMSGLAAGIRAKAAEVIAEIVALLKRAKGLLPGSPIKWGPLKNWNGGGAGERLLDLVALGITKATPKTVKAAESAFAKIGDALKSTRDGLQSTLDGLKSDFASIADSVSSAFTGNLFEATTTGDFIASLTAKQGELQGLLASFKTLQGWGIPGAFLSQLFASGNGALITELAGMGQAGAVGAANLFGDVQSLGSQLGNAVASNDPVANRIDETNKQLVKANEQLAYLADDIGKALNGAAASAQRDKKRGPKK